MNSMNNMNYVDDLMKNYPLNYNNEISAYSPNESPSQNMPLVGGADLNTHRPTGGFPPIYLCDLKKDTDTDNTSTDNTNSDNTNNTSSSRLKIREYVPSKMSISIKDIMEQRRKKT
jgi:hypothetical protein